MTDADYADRSAAGQALAAELAVLDLEDPVVLALPRGGVPVALPVARVLDAPLDLILVRKIGCPGQPELAAGAIVDGPPEHVHLNIPILRAFGLRRKDLAQTIETRRAELADRRRRWLGGRGPVAVAGRSAILVDDGIATGATVQAALMALRDRGPARIVLAVPVAAQDTLENLAPLVDQVVCPLVPRDFQAVGLHYRRFDQVSDDTVTRIMAEARHRTQNGEDKAGPPADTQ